MLFVPYFCAELVRKRLMNLMENIAGSSDLGIPKFLNPVDMNDEYLLREEG